MDENLLEQLKICNDNLAVLEKLLSTEADEFFELYHEIQLAPVGFWGAEKALALIDGKWKHAILMRLFRNKSMRYSQIKRELEEYGITDYMLSASLKELTRDKLVIKTIYPEVPVRVEYSVTHKAFTLWKIFLELSYWYNSYQKEELELNLTKV